MQCQLSESGVIVLPREVANAIGPGPIDLQLHDGWVELRPAPSDDRLALLAELRTHIQSIGLTEAELAQEVRAVRAATKP